MAEPKPRDQDKFTFDSLAPAPRQDYRSVLIKVIDEVTRDPAQLRKLVYALARNCLKPDPQPTHSLSDVKQQASAMFELELAKCQLERAIETIEKHAALEAQASEESGGEATAPPSEDLPVADKLRSLHDHLKNLDENLGGEPDPSVVQPVITPSDKAIVILPERVPTWFAQRSRDEQFPDYGLPWDRRYHDALHAAGYAPAQRGVRVGLLPFLQLVAAAFIGVVIYVSLAGWFQIAQQTSQPPPAVAAPLPAQPVETTVRASNPAVTATTHTPEPNSPLPFPLPRSYGVYASADGQLVELSQLPFKVPDSRILLSAEIIRPSHATLPTGDLSFVVFRRDLVNSAPQTVPVRVVARVSRVMKFVNGRPAVSPIEGTWRIRSKAYDLKVTPIEGRPEMILLQPESGFVFSPGRYALVLNGFGFDFSVAGTIRSPEQCLEQAEVVNGTILNECPNT
jgi:hypothetical protein